MRPAFPLILVVLVVVTGTVVHRESRAANIRITNDTATSDDPSVVVGEDGNVRVVWSDTRTGSRNIFWALRDQAGGPLVGPIQVSSSTASSRYPRVSSDASGTSFVVWQEGDSFSGQAYFARVSASGVVEVTPTPLSAGPGLHFTPDIVTDSLGTSYVVCDEADGSLSRFRFLAVDEAGTVICNRTPGYAIGPLTRSPVLDFDATSGYLNCLYIDEDYFNKRLARAIYSPVPPCSQISNVILFNSAISWPALLSDRIGPAWILYQLGNGIYRWVPPATLVSPPPGPTRRPRVAGGDNTPVIAVWEDSGTGSALIRGGEWDSTGALVTNALEVSVDAVAPATPDIATDRHGLFYVVWTDQRDGNAEIYMEIIDRAVHGGNSKIAGFVNDAFNGRPIGLASITATSQADASVYTGLTDRHGKYEVSVTPGAEYTISIAHPGYKPAIAPTTGVVDDGQTYPAGTTRMTTKTVLLVHGLNSDARMWRSNGPGDFSFAKSLADMDYNVDSTLTMVNSWYDWLGANGGAIRQQQKLALHLLDLRSQGIQSVDVVAHSMGGIVSRLQLILEEPGPYSIRHLIMLGTPNHGSELANAVSTAWVLMLARDCSIDPLFCAIKLFGGEYPQAYFDLSTGSPLLRAINYQGGPATGNFACLPHDPVTTLNAVTKFTTYAGTHLPLGCLHPYNVPGYLLWALTGCNGDGIVPVNSVRLIDATNPTRVENFKDNDCSCVSSHDTPFCTPMAEDICVAEGVARALQGLPFCDTGGFASLEEGKQTEDPAGLLLADGIVLAPGDSTTKAMEAGSADSLAVEANWWTGDLRMELVAPGGSPITPDSALVDPDVDYTEDTGSARYLLRNPAPGSWQIRFIDTSPDSTWGVLGAVEYSSLTMVTEVEEKELAPGGFQLVEAKLSSNSAPVLGATVAATITDPDKTILDLILKDDGTGGDVTAGDGVYSGSANGHSLTGVYEVEVVASGSYGSGQTLNRAGQAMYIVEERPDVVLADSTVLVIPEEVSPPGLSQLMVTIEAGISNAGSRAADSVLVVFLEEASQTAFAETTLIQLGPGEETTVSATWPVEVSAARIGLGAQAFVLGGVPETNIFNNEGHAELQVTGVPDDADRIDESEPGRPDSGPITFIGSAPNPSRSGTTIYYQLEREADVRVSIYDIVGRLVVATERQREEMGEHAFRWDGRSGTRVEVAAGIYFGRVEADNWSKTTRMVLVR